MRNAGSRNLSVDFLDKSVPSSMAECLPVFPYPGDNLPSRRVLDHSLTPCTRKIPTSHTSRGLTQCTPIHPLSSMKSSCVKQADIADRKPYPIRYTHAFILSSVAKRLPDLICFPPRRCFNTSSSDESAIALRGSFAISSPRFSD